MAMRWSRCVATTPPPTTSPSRPRTRSQSGPLSVATPFARSPARAAAVVDETFVFRRHDGVRGFLRLMREVDGGVSTLLSDVRRFQLRYFNRLGNVTDDAREVVRVQVRIEVGTQGLVLSRDIAIRT